ncbi:Superoxide dismutase [Cu-Zn] [Meloidogyne graminicola]|uniref:Superoxide dismutase [Cu-Zn] n=1 Tax=Meloidogyne graminicola TaxID=189291 RepID=A0A8S9ZX19_9BILA|nr:Superoxide dismutase [Cu-Zn] [Meloidogyne graminicola]
MTTQQVVCVLNGDADKNVKGTIRFRQEKEGSPTRIEGEITGLSPGLHGSHVHSYGDLSNGCVSAGPHYNPTNMTHGGPQDEVRHVGDLGNVHVKEDQPFNIRAHSQSPVAGTSSDSDIEFEKALKRTELKNLHLQKILLEEQIEEKRLQNQILQMEIKAKKEK